MKKLKIGSKTKNNSITAAKPSTGAVKGSALSRGFKLNKYGLLVFALTFGLLGFFLWHSFAAVPGSVGDCVSQASWGTDLPNFETQLITRINQDRASTGAGPVKAAPALNRTAEYKSMNMSEYEYLAHDDPAPVARGIGDRFVACGYPGYDAWGENIAYGFTSPDSVEDAFLSGGPTEGHYQNIMNPTWTTVGVGAAQASNGLIFWTEDFGTTSEDDYNVSSDKTPPSVPTGLNVWLSKTDELDFKWNASTDNDQVAGYGLYLNGQYQLTASDIQSSFTNLTCGTTYTIAVDAVDRAGNRSGQASVLGTTADCAGGGDTQKPSTPTKLKVTGTTQTTVSLSWKASTDNKGVTGYDLYSNSGLVGTTTTTSGTISGLACGTTFTVGVDAYDAAKNKSTTASVSAVTAACPTGITVPGAPTSLVATPGTKKGTINLTWKAPSSNGGAAITDYVLSRGQKTNKENLQADSITCSTSTCTYTDKAASGTLFFYKIAAENSKGVGPTSNEASAVGK